MENLYKLKQELALMSNSEIISKFMEDSMRTEISNMSDSNIKVQKDAFLELLKVWRDDIEKEKITETFDNSKEDFYLLIPTINVLKEKGKIELTDEEEKTLDIVKEIADKEIEKDEKFRDQIFYTAAASCSLISAIAKESQEECFIKTEALLERITDEGYLEKFKNKGVKMLEETLLQIKGVDDETKMNAMNFMDYVINNSNFDKTITHNGHDTPVQ